MMHRGFHLSMRKDFPVQWPSTGTGCPERWRFSFTGDIPELPGHNPVRCALGWPCWGRSPTVVSSNMTHPGILWSPLLQCWQHHEKSLLEQKTRVLCLLYIKLNIHTNCNMLGDNVKLFCEGNLLIYLKNCKSLLQNTGVLFFFFFLLIFLTAILLIWLFHILNSIQYP